MTLATVSRYERDRLSAVGDRAVVVGGSVAGLLAARVLADGFEEVTVVERDALPAEPTARRGVPQGSHVHALLEAGRATIEDLFPGYGEVLLSSGGVVIDAATDLVHHENGGVLADGPTRVPMYCATRPLIEHAVRRRVSDLDGVAVRSGRQFTGYLADDATAVKGVAVRDENGDRAELAADLVVDATGRTSGTPTWLDERGYAAPDVDEVEIGLAYSSVFLERPADDRRGFIVMPEPTRPRGASMLPVEGDRWQLTLFGVHGDHPPTDTEGLRAFGEGLPIPELTRLLDAQPWISDDVAHYPFPSNRRRRYEDLDRFPDGLVVVGDAIASYNPIYGQGMSVAALQALLLHEALAEGGPDDLALRFFDRTEDVVDVPWSIAVGGDFRFDRTSGPKPRGTDFFNPYLDRLIRKAQTDGELRGPLLRVFMMERPPSSLLRPGVAWRVLKPGRPAIGRTSRASSTKRSQKPS